LTQYTINGIQGKNEEIVSDYFKGWKIMSEVGRAIVYKDKDEKEYGVRILASTIPSRLTKKAGLGRVVLTNELLFNDLTLKLKGKEKLTISIRD